MFYAYPSHPATSHNDFIGLVLVFFFCFGLFLFLKKKSLCVQTSIILNAFPACVLKFKNNKVMTLWS